MKKIIIAAACALIGFSAFALDVFMCAPIQGVVSSFTSKEYTVYQEFGEYFRRLQGRQEHVLNSDGFEVELTEYTARDVEMGKMKRTYDAVGNILSESYYDADAKLMWREVTSYNGDKKTDSCDYNSEGEMKSKVIYKYDGENLADESFYNAKGALTWKIIYKYDENNRLVKKSMYSANGYLDEEESYTYLENGKMDTIVYIDAYQNTVSREVFRYGTNDQLLEVISYDGDNVVTKRTQFKFDKVGNVIRVSEYEVAQKFGTTVNELVAQTDYSYKY